MQWVVFFLKKIFSDVIFKPEVGGECETGNRIFLGVTSCVTSCILFASLVLLQCHRLVILDSLWYVAVDNSVHVLTEPTDGFQTLLYMDHRTWPIL